LMSLYDRITALHGHRPWGAVLDAGTGRSSMRWLLGLDTERWTAITGAESMAEKTRLEIGERIRDVDRLVVGNWMDPELLAGEQYDVVLADYLLGAIEGFAPYWQDQLFQRLRPLVKRRLYMIGLEPYVHLQPQVSASAPASQMVVAIGRLRDACLLLAGDRPYREYPLDPSPRTRRISCAGCGKSPDPLWRAFYQQPTGFSRRLTWQTARPAHGGGDDPACRNLASPGPRAGATRRRIAPWIRLPAGGRAGVGGKVCAGTGLAFHRNDAQDFLSCRARLGMLFALHCNEEGGRHFFKRTYMTSRALHRADRVGLTAAFLCALHCALLPLLLGILPALGMGLSNLEGMDVAFVILASLLGVTTVALGWRRHRVSTPWYALLFGLALLWVGEFTPVHHHSVAHAVFMSVGGLSVAGAHFLNMRLAHAPTRACGCVPAKT